MTTTAPLWTCPLCSTGFDAVADLAAHQAADHPVPVLTDEEATRFAGGTSDKILAIFAEDYADRTDLGDNGQTLLAAVRAEIKARGEIAARAEVALANLRRRG